MLLHDTPSSYSVSVVPFDMSSSMFSLMHCVLSLLGTKSVDESAWLSMFSIFLTLKVVLLAQYIVHANDYAAQYKSKSLKQTHKLNALLGILWQRHHLRNTL